MKTTGVRSVALQSAISVSLTRVSTGDIRTSWARGGRILYRLVRYHPFQLDTSAIRRGPSGTDADIRSGRGPRAGDARVLAPRLRAGNALRPDRGNGHQSAEPLRRVRQQGAVVPAVARGVLDRP